MERTQFMDIFEAAMNEAGHRIWWVDATPGDEKWDDDGAPPEITYRAMALACLVTGEWFNPSFDDWLDGVCNHETEEV